MESLFKFFWNGFGLGSESLAARAAGMAICVLLAGVFILYFIIRAIVRLVIKMIASKKAQAQTQVEYDNTDVVAD